VFNKELGLLNLEFVCLSVTELIETIWMNLVSFSKG